MYKFNNTNIITKFIKQLLKDTYIPNVLVWKPGMVIYQNWTYVTKNNIIKAKVNWKPNEYDLGPQSEYDNNYFDIIEPFVEGKFYKGITSNFVSNISGYDANTHYFLGKYLRNLKDLHNLNLMPYYNCWCGEYTDNYRISENKLEKVLSIKDGYNMLIVPINLNENYTIVTDSNFPISYCVGYYNNGNLLNETLIVNPKTITRCSSTSITEEQVVKNITTQNEQQISNREYLTLFIQVPENIFNKVVVLEGDHYKNVIPTSTNNKLTKRIIDFNSNTTDKDVLNSIITSPSLVRILDRNIYAFSDRLVEYLFLNVIWKDDEIYKNITRIQNYISSYNCKLVYDNYYNSTYTKGIWNTRMQKFIYDLVTTNKKDSCVLDINGYVDKDSEEILSRIK